MKKIINSLTLLVLAAVIISCEGTTLVDEVFDGTRSGTVLRTLSSSLELDLFDQSTAVSITVEEQDESNGANFASMNVYASFVDNNFTDATDRMNLDEILLTNIPASSFTPSEKGLPQYTFTETFANLVSTFSLADGEFTGGDIFVIRLEAVMVNGDTWSLEEASQNITGSAYFNSQYAYNATIVCAVDETFFLGNYTATYQGYTGGFGDLLNLGAISGTIELVESDGSTSRQFTVDYNGFGFDMVFIMDFVCENVTTRPNGLGASCGSGDISTAGNPVPFDIADDSSFDIAFVETDDGGCGFGAGGLLEISFVKQ